MVRIIVNADDFGYNVHTFEWTVRGFEIGALTSATIMAGMPLTNQAVDFAKSHPQYSFGVHFCLVDEKPLCQAREITSLIDPLTGHLWSTRQFIIRNFLGLVRVEDLKNEMRAQFMAIRDAGVVISHVDGHGHNHRLPQSIKALAELKEELGIVRVRRCQDTEAPGGKIGMMSRIINAPMQRRLAKAGFGMADHFVMNAGHSASEDWFSRTLKSLPEGITEIGVHPGSDEPWRKIDTEDCFANCSRLCAELGIEKVNYNDI